jgi:hypothetical protein
MKKRKAASQKKADALLFTSVSTDKLHPSLARHLASTRAQTARFDDVAGTYTFQKAGGTRSCGGLINLLKHRYYPDYKDNRSKRKWKTVNVKGSTAAQGKRVDAQIAAYVGSGVVPTRLCPMAKALLDYMHSKGHQMQAAQVPVEIPDNGVLKLTQADLITRDNDGKLWLWECKTGAPVGFKRKQGKFKGDLLGDVDATKRNIWHLQLHHTYLALKAAGVEISEARVIQVNEERKQEGLHFVTIYVPPEWTTRIVLQNQQ